MATPKVIIVTGAVHLSINTIGQGHYNLTPF